MADPATTYDFFKLNTQPRPNNPTPPSNSSRLFSCLYCTRKFYTFQALGVHQNAHNRFRGAASRSLTTVHSPTPAAHAFELNSPPYYTAYWLQSWLDSGAFNISVSDPFMRDDAGENIFNESEGGVESMPSVEAGRRFVREISGTTVDTVDPDSLWLDSLVDGDFVETTHETVVPDSLFSETEESALVVEDSDVEDDVPGRFPRRSLFQRYSGVSSDSGVKMKVLESANGVYEQSDKFQDLIHKFLCVRVPACAKCMNSYDATQQNLYERRRLEFLFNL